MEEPHPVGVTSSEGTWRMDYLGYPLEQGKLICSTCHDEASHGKPDPANQNFLRGGPYPDTDRFCYRCHIEDKEVLNNPHKQVDGFGRIREESCRFCHKGTPDPAKPSPAALERLAAHDWPGNVRELEALLLRSAELSRREVLIPEDLTWEAWPARARKAELTVLALHPTPELVREYVHSERGQAFLATCQALGLDEENFPDRLEALDRYLDRVERRDGVLRIALRRCTIEWAVPGGSLPWWCRVNAVSEGLRDQVDEVFEFHADRRSAAACGFVRHTSA